MIFDVAIIGGGLLGLASGHELLNRDPRRKILVIEKEDKVAAHQSGRNSGVVHAGVYYKPGSFKATFCREGKSLLENFCRDRSIKYKTVGKLIVATNDDELSKLDQLLERATANGVKCKKVSRDEIREIEPSSGGISGIHVPETAIVDFPGVAESLKQSIREMGGDVFTNSRLSSANLAADGAWQLETSGGTIAARFVLNCGGLHSDRIASMMGISPKVRIVPFRGEYWLVRKDKDNLCNGLIYPVPDPKFPFLGVHITRMINGRVECGPNAVLALSREGYSWGKIDLREIASLCAYKPFWRFSLNHFMYGLDEVLRSISKARFASAARKLLPALCDEDLEPGGSGVRAQAMNHDGSLCDDFVIQPGEKALHILNAPSPAATSCLAIGRYIADRVVF